MKRIPALYRRHGVYRPQRGMALLMVMVILLLVSVLALFSVRGTIIQTQIAQAALTQNYTLQAAEAGLTQAEQWLVTHPQPVFPVITAEYGARNVITQCNAGICAMSVPPIASHNNIGALHFWADVNFWENCVAHHQCLEGTAIEPWAIKPRFVIEDYGYSNENIAQDVMARNPLRQPGIKLMRITAWARLGDSHSMAQAIVKR